MDSYQQQTIIEQLLDALADRVAGKLQGQQPQKDLYTIPDLCQRYGVSDDTVVRWMRAGEFGETVNPTPKMHLVTLAGVQEFDARHTGPAYNSPRRVIRRRTVHREAGPI